MSDPTDELFEALRVSRLRQAVLVTALRRLALPLTVTRRDAFESAAHDVDVEQTEDGVLVSLVPAPQPRR
jgi:hypothetical protein